MIPQSTAWRLDLDVYVSFGIVDAHIRTTPKRRNLRSLEKLFGPVGVTTPGQSSVFLALRTRDADASFRRRVCARNSISAAVKMAEAPIGQSNCSRSKLTEALCADNVTVLDGGTGFLKVGYAAQVHAPISDPTFVGHATPSEARWLIGK